jgi:hypothetical protein
MLLVDDACEMAGELGRSFDPARLDYLAKARAQKLVDPLCVPAATTFTTTSTRTCPKARSLQSSAVNLTENNSSDHLMECGSVPMILGWSHQIWVPSQIMWAEVRPQSQLIWAGNRDDVAPRLR